MNLGLFLPCSVLLFSLAACGGESPKAAPSPAAPPAAPSASAPAPSLDQVPAKPATPPANAAATPAPAASGAAQDPAAQKPLPRTRVDAVTAKALFGRDPSADPVEPGTPDQVALGKALFHATSLSKSGAMSCASCHDLAKYGTDGKAKAPAGGGPEGGRNVPTVFNAARQYAQFWDYRAPTVEAAVVPHALAVQELGDEATLLAKVKGDAELAAGFTKAFPGAGDAVTADNIGRVVGAFLRTLVTKSKFDAWLDGDAKALNNDELFGLAAFMRLGCTTCHGTRLVGGNMPQKTGLLKPYASKDTGRALFSKSDADKFFFKVPTLSNVEKTAPYFHDGSTSSLEEAITLMADIQLDKKLTPDELRGLVAFMKALTGPLPEGFAAAK
jgi:cytochrome c peroxidase